MRPKVAKAVMANREQLLVKLIGVAEKIRSEFSEKKFDDVNNMSAAAHVSPTIASIYYSRKALYRVS